MPSIIYVRKNPPSPIRRFPKGVEMNLIEPSHYACRGCKKRTKHYADGVIWCETCGKTVHPNDAVNVTRGRQINTPSPSFKKLKVD